MSAHTPGPWKVVKGQYANEGRLFVMTQYNDGYKRDICEITSVTPEHFDHDARLIAAAPRMLEVLKLVTAHCVVECKDQDHCQHFICQAQNEARAILRDVEGENG